MSILEEKQAVGLGANDSVLRRAWLEGDYARRTNKNRDDCPYHDSNVFLLGLAEHEHRTQWLKGWDNQNKWIAMTTNQQAGANDDESRICEIYS